MFDKYGFFKNSEELNKAAAGFLHEGDIESLKGLAEENGIDKEDAKDYEDGVTDELVTPVTAAMGRLKVLKDFISKISNKQHRANQNMILLILNSMIDDPVVAAGVMDSKNIVTDVVDVMKAGNIYTGTDEDMRTIAYSVINGDAEKKIEEIRKRYE